jgi:hypothetical protein
MKPLSFTMSFTAKSLDEVVAVVGDLRAAAAILPFKSVSPVVLGCQPRSIGFQISPGYSVALLPFVLVENGKQWTGTGSCATGRVLDTHDLIIYLHLHLALTLILDYASYVGISVEVEDSTGYWKNRSVHELVRRLPDHDALLSEIDGRLLTLLTGEFTSPCLADEDEIEREVLGSLSSLISLTTEDI